MHKIIIKLYKDAKSPPKTNSRGLQGGTVNHQVHHVLDDDKICWHNKVIRLEFIVGTIIFLA